MNHAVSRIGTAQWTPMMNGDFIADYPTKQCEDGGVVQISTFIGADWDEDA